MPDVSFEETCPCGNSVKITGYTSEVRLQIRSWRSIHNKHTNAIAKQIIEERRRNPPYVVIPSDPLITNTDTPRW